MGTPCDVDTDCLDGEHCAGAGAGCTTDCGDDHPCPTGMTCGDDGRCSGGATDGGTTSDARVDAGVVCRNAADCDDDAFCNGAERCTPGASDAAPNGCAPGISPCAGGATCDEATDHCATSCDEDMDGNGRIDADNDGDGHRSIACGAAGSIAGDDCDDEDADRYPRTFAEICDDADPGHDEDCDPCTVADYLADDGDDDGDGFVSETCSNPLRESDDVSTFTCPGTVNEFTRVRAEDRAVTGNDCNDTPGEGNGIDPGVAEICNGIDDNCDDLIDGAMPGLVCECLIGAPARSCGDTDVGACAFGTQNCIDGMWGECIGAIGPVMEYCGGGDANCNGSVDEGFRVDCVLDSDNDRRRDGGDSPTSQCRTSGRDLWGECPFGYITPAASLAEDCADSDSGAWRWYRVRTDADDDNYCVGAAATDRCGGDMEPAGYSEACAGTDDCNDSVRAINRNTACRVDFDLDGYCSGGISNQCNDGSTCSTNYRIATTCLGGSGVNDVYDLNRCVWDSSQLYTYPECSAGPFSCFPTAETRTCTTPNCPFGYHPTTCDPHRLPGSQNGRMSTAISGNACRLTLSCNGLDSAIARADLTCEADLGWGGGCGPR